MRLTRVSLGVPRAATDGGRRYRPIEITFDTRATTLTMTIEPHWDPAIQEQWRENQRRLREQLTAEYGLLDADRKINDFAELGPAPWSIVFQHNALLNQIRDAFAFGAYYPALVGACALGERILNQLILELRDDYRDHPAASKRIRNAERFNDWPHLIDVLEAWRVFATETANTARRLAELRHLAVHFGMHFTDAAREEALQAINLVQAVIEDVMSPHGGPPRFIADTAGVTFFALAGEAEPLVRRIFLPRSALVSPRHSMTFNPTPTGMAVEVFDDAEYPTDELTDEEFAQALPHAMPEAARAIDHPG